MAEGDSSQNQGQQPQKIEAKDGAGEVLDQKKAERAEKERERRRRRRRKKAQLKKLQRETSPELEEAQRKVVEKPQNEPAEKFPEKRGPKQVPAERHVIRRSDEHVPRFPKTLVQEGQPVKPHSGAEPSKDEQTGTPQEPAHPLEHKTHSFTGPLLGGGQGEDQPQKPVEAPVESQPLEPVSEPVTEEPALPQQPEPIQPEPEPEPLSQPQPATRPLSGAEEAEEITIKSGKEEQRPKVGMGEVYDEDEEEIPEIPSIFPYPPQEEPPEEEKVKPRAVELPEKEEEEQKEEIKKVHEGRESSKETVSEPEGLNRRKSALQGAGAFSAGVIKKIGEAFHNFRLKHNVVRWIGSFLVFMLIGGGLYAGYLFRLHEKAYDFVTGFFKAPPPVEVSVDEKLLREWGITAAYVFGDNRGSTGDLLASQLFNAYFFGRLAEPRLEGETGITAAYFYGTGADLDAATNRFIAYVKNLRELVSVYDVDVYAMLDEKTDREKALNDYLAKLKEIMEKSEGIVQEISIEVDDLKVSFQSLDPEKTRFEEDFFVALQGLAGEKADFLLKSFIDVSQKQSALKAHVAALEKLLTYYESSMERLSIRILSIEKNHEALVQGIRVVDIPGANLDIIIRETP